MTSKVPHPPTLPIPLLRIYDFRTWGLGEGLWDVTKTGEVGKAGSGDPGGPAQLRCSVPGGRTNHGAGSMQTSEE